MNLVQQANFLEDVPKEQLVSMSQDPNAQFPPFLVLSEIQRRTTNEKNYQAMVNQPTTTVAEEVVSDFAQPTGLQGGAPQATPLPTNISAGLSGAPTAPMQMAASGGITGYATGDMTALPAGSAPMMGAGMGMDALGDNLEAAIEQYGVPALKTLGIINDDGSINYGTAALQALSINPAFRLGKAGLGVLGSGLSRFAPGTMSKLKGLPSKIKNRFTSPVSKVDERIITSGSMQTDRVFDAAKSGKTLLNTAQNVALPALVVKSMLPDGEEIVTEETAQDVYEKLLIPSNNKDVDTDSKSKGLGQMDYRDMIRLGVGIMGAKDMSELGKSVVGVLDAQDKRGLVGLQGQLTKAQILKLESDIENQPLEQLQATASILYKGISDGSLDRETNIPILESYMKRIQELQNVVVASTGSEAVTNAEQKILDQAKA